MSAKYKIIGLNARDFRRIVAADMEFDPEKGLITVGGNNGHGKTSILLAIEHALTNVKIQNRDREGGDGAKIRVIIGEETPDGWAPAFKVIRSGGKLSVYLANQDAQVQRPAEWLENMVQQAFVDPFEFLNAKPIDQRQMFLEAVGVDTSEVDAKIRRLLDSKNDAEKLKSASEARAASLPEYPELGTEEKSVAEIASRLNAAHMANMEIERQQSLHDDALATVQRLEADLARARMHLESTPAPDGQVTDVGPIQAELQSVEETNAKIRANIAKRAGREEWKSAETALGAIVTDLQAAQREKLALMASVELPLPGLSVDENSIVYHGQPLAAASDAERITVAVALATHGESKLKPIFVKNASLLDRKTMALITELAQARGAQVFAEIVSDQMPDGSYNHVTDFVLENGELAGSEPEQPTLDA